MCISGERMLVDVGEDEFFSLKTQKVSGTIDDKLVIFHAVRIAGLDPDDSKPCMLDEIGYTTRGGIKCFRCARQVWLRPSENEEK